MPTVIGVDSSTQSCKALVVDVDSGEITDEASVAHPEGTEVDPQAWWDALQQCLDRVDTSAAEAIAIGAQQHGLVALDSNGSVVRPALLWNDTRSAPQADTLIKEFGAADLAERTGSVPVASLTSTKLAWLRQHEPEHASRVAAVALPHDWLTWRLRGYGPTGEAAHGPDFEQLVTDRSDASGTGYFSPTTNGYDDDILQFVLGHRPEVPRVAGPDEGTGSTPEGWITGPGGGDNAMAALGLGVRPGDAIMSLGTSGTVFASTSEPAVDPTGMVAGFADASGGFLPLGATLNATRVIDSVRQFLGLSWEEFSLAAQQAPAGSEGLSLLPFFDGERMPNLPDATGTLGGLTRHNLTSSNLARASIEAVVANLSRGLDAIAEMTHPFSRILLIGGGAHNEGIQKVTAQTTSVPVVVPQPAEYVAFGAARQAAWVLTRSRPEWAPPSLPVSRDVDVSPARGQFESLLERHRH